MSDRTFPAKPSGVGNPKAGKALVGKDNNPSLGGPKGKSMIPKSPIKTSGKK